MVSFFYTLARWPSAALLSLPAARRPLPAKAGGAFTGSGKREAGSVRPFIAGLFVILCLLFAGQSMAATPPGTIIRSQAEASFVDEFNEQYLVTSNEVTTLIQEVTGVRLDSEQDLWGIDNKTVVYPHLLTNSGNTLATYTLKIDTTRLPNNPNSKPWENNEQDRIETQLYYDRDHSGQPKEGNEVEGTISLHPGENVSLLIQATVPNQDHNEVALFARVTGKECENASGTTASAQGRCLAVNRNKLSRSKGVVYEVKQSTDKKVAYINEEVKTKLSFMRMENRTYISYVEMEYQLPEELEYITGSSKLCPYNLESWDDRTIARTCKNVSDPQFIPDVSQPQWLRYYVREKDRGDDDDKIPSPGHEGQILFETRVKSGVSKTLYNVAEYTFQEVGINGSIRHTTNYIPLEIKGFGVSLNASSLSSEPHIGEPQIVASAMAGGIVEFTNYLWNLGTEPTGYEVTLGTKGQNTFPNGSLFCLTTEESCTDFSETPDPLIFNKDAISPGSYQEIRLFIQLPDTGFDPQPSYSLTLKAKDTSTDHSYVVTDTTRNMLIKILGSTTSSMDLTLEKPQSDSDTSIPGTGPGPEAAPLTTLAGHAGTSLIFEKIYINNTGGQADNYQLKLLPGPRSPLPETFKWSFVNQHNQPIASSGTVPAGQSIEVKLQIELPAGYPPETWAFYVHARSSVTKVEDSLHLALEVLGEQQLTLTPDRQGQVTPGSFITFAHQLSNPGNLEINDIKLTLTNTKESQGWQGIVYQDNNGDGQLSSDDTIMPASFPLPAGETQWLIVKLFAPANAAQGETNITTLTATWGDNQSLMVTDTTLVNSTNVVITKQQVAWNCKPPVPESFSTNTFPVKPGTCVVYQLTASNHGVETAHNVIIHDRAPAFTQFENSNGLPFTKTDGEQKSEQPPNGSVINATWPELSPGESVSLIYGLRIQ